MATLAPISAADTPDARTQNGSAPKTVQVSGQLVPVDLENGIYDVKGELIGTWTFPPAETSTYYQSSTRLYQKGTEYFDGCLNTDGDDKCDRSEPSGRWRSDYIYWASLDRGGRLIEGGCIHPLNGGSGAFTGVRGLLQMTDVYASTAAGSTAIYQGEVILNAVKEKPVTKSASTGLGSPSSARAATVGC
ncbi:MAG: hypothetical protein ABWX96_11225 [Propionibacteriaceae bacterium]